MEYFQGRNDGEYVPRLHRSDIYRPEQLEYFYVENIAQMFQGCEALAAVDVSGWDTSKVSTMGEMFAGCKALTAVDLSSWDTSGLTGVQNMFMDCSSLATVTLGANTLKTNIFKDGDTSFLPNYDSTWYYVNGYLASDPIDINSQRTGDGLFGAYDSQTGMGYNPSTMAGRWSTTGADLNNLTCGINVKPDYTAGENGQYAVSFRKNDPNGADPQYAADCKYFIAHPVSLPEGAAVTAVSFGENMSVKGKSAKDMFSGLSNVTSMNLSNLDVSGVTDMRSMFSGCSSLAGLDLSGWDTSAVTEMNSVFENCSSLAAVNLGRDTLNAHIFTDSFDHYGADWYYIGQNQDAVDPDYNGSPKSGDGLFGDGYDPDTMAGTWVTDADYFAGQNILTLPAGLTTIGDSAFEELDSVDKVVLSNAVATVGSRAFAGCGALHLVQIPNAGTEIEDDTFAGSPGVVISCPPESAAVTFAQDKHIPYRVE